MSVGIVDTTVILHYFRHYPNARVWLDAQPVQMSITSITWMEVMEGASNKAKQEESRILLDRFELVHLTAADQYWAMKQLERFQFSHHIGMNDCMIASVVNRLHLPLYTHNLRHMQPLLGDLAVKPYA